MSKSFSVNVKNKHGFIWLTLPDSVDMDNYKNVEERIMSEVDKSDSVRIVIDFCNTRSLFSSGIGVIIRIHKRIEEKNGLFHLVNVSDRIREGLANVGVDRLLSVYESEEKFVEKEMPV